MLCTIGIVLSSCSTIPEKKKDDTVVEIRTTAYTHSERDHLKYGRKTATGTTLKPGIAAADLSVFPIGTILELNGKKYEIQDYGRALVKPRNQIPTVDVYVSSKTEMKKWGVRYFDAHVVCWGKLEDSEKLLSDRLRFKHCREMYNRIKEKL